MKATVHTTIQGVWVRRVRDCYVSPPNSFSKNHGTSTLSTLLVIPKNPGFPLQSYSFRMGCFDHQSYEKSGGVVGFLGNGHEKTPLGNFWFRPSDLPGFMKPTPSSRKYLRLFLGVSTPQNLLPTGSISHRIHVWYIHLHLLQKSTKCR